jgi:hypothetical protein
MAESALAIIDHSHGVTVAEAEGLTRGDDKAAAAIRNGSPAHSLTRSLTHSLTHRVSRCAQQR